MFYQKVTEEQPFDQGHRFFRSQQRIFFTANVHRSLLAQPLLLPVAYSTCRKTSTASVMQNYR